jgi:hypothetical protein
MNVQMLRLRPAVERLCQAFCVRRLKLFGSATSGRFDPSRIDFDPWSNLSKKT